MARGVGRRFAQGGSKLLLSTAASGHEAVMKVYALQESPSSSLATALAEFESPFSYPLGPDMSFYISHGKDYSLFFRAQGNGTCFIAEHRQRILGVIGTAI